MSLITMRKWSIWVVAALGLGMLLAGCGGGGASNEVPDPTVRFFNGVSDTSRYDFFVDEDLLASDIDFLESSADFEAIRELIHSVIVTITGTTTEIWAEDFDFEGDKDYVISTLGLENYGNEPLKRARLFGHEVDRSVPNGSVSRVYVVHGFNREAGFQTPNIDFQNPGNNPQFRVTDIAFGEAKVLTVDATTQTFQARRAGTEAVYATTTFTFQAGKVYMAYVLGVENGSGNFTPQIQLVELSTE